MTKTLICDCNKTMPLDSTKIGQALDEQLTLHTTLCRREAGAFQRALKSGDDVVVACTQERRFFVDLAAETEGAPSLDEQPIRFVNIRETGGWSRSAKATPAGLTPKVAAQLALAKLPQSEPVPSVTYQSAGQVLIIGEASAAYKAAALVADKLTVSVLLTSSSQSGQQAQQERKYAEYAGQLKKIDGWLGAFTVSWTVNNPIDLDLCTRCNACVQVCPEGAIGSAFQIDLSRCKNHRECVKVCQAAGAIDFTREPRETSERFDLVLDLSAEPRIKLHVPPQGYFHANPEQSDAALFALALKMRELVGEFEKPKFFQYQQKLCAHSRNEQVGCKACIDVCSAQAISSDLERKAVKVNPNLCVGCGACSTVCPSGAMTYAYPKASEQGVRLKTLIGTYLRAGGSPPTLLLHSQEAGTALLNALGQEAQREASQKLGLNGVPTHVLPYALWHTASLGLDVWLAAIAYGAAKVVVLSTGEEAPQYLQALREQMQVAQTVLTGLGYAGKHFHVMEANKPQALDAALQSLNAQAAITVSQPAKFSIAQEKRTTLDAAIDHLLAQAPKPVDVIDLSETKSSPFGALQVNRDTCTLCLSCVSACPESALIDNADKPQLRFLEKNCVQCGLCASVCPEDAITLQPRLLLTRERREAQVLNEAQPWACVRCGKPFGTVKAIENMLGKLSGHSMFQGEALERLKMCSDCRVIDMFSATNETKINKLS